MFGFPSVLFLSITSVYAAPLIQTPSFFGPSPSVYQHLPVGRSPISKYDMMEIGRLATAVNSAYCHDDILQPHFSHPFMVQTGRHRHQERQLRHAATSIVKTSDDAENSEGIEKGDMRWYISHTPSTQTLTLVFSSLENVDDLLELVASEYDVHSNSTTGTLVELPSNLFPSSRFSHPDIPLIHRSYLSSIDTHGTSALFALLHLIEEPPVSVDSTRDVIRNYVRSLANPSAQAQPHPIRNVQIVGHGLGSAVGMIVALALKEELLVKQRDLLPTIDVTATLFGLPRVGNAAFGAFVDDTASSASLRIFRITSYADTIPHLPERHHGLVHPSSVREVWIGADPRVAYICKPKSNGEESEDCAASIPLGKTSLLDHLGPFGGIRITPGSCSRSA
ncbi:hypothetical protein CI109_101057 [Kwoniella shandongensis]|uniref:Fungal lipase-type domain-containing protein n=1 Tax=Kwoniella shandongensis TaxID=1734106 RepID=A0A5M6C5R6_9TREE|nr:uncharacterized protein CI109_001526 [Kwoniella shandongensis]KAA5530121.1 hypothetical protein CI109_001526 [Kwoniella shandongensis]